MIRLRPPTKPLPLLMAVLLVALVLLGQRRTLSAGTDSASTRTTAAPPTAVAATWQQSRLPGLHCNAQATPLRCDIYGIYRGWLAYVRYVHKPVRDAHWTPRYRRYLRHHPGVAAQLASPATFRHLRGARAGFRVNQGSRHRAKVQRKGGGPEWCKTLTISRLVESSIFREDLFTAYHMVRWCYDDLEVYHWHHSQWTEIDVHDPFTVRVDGETDHHDGPLPEYGNDGWYTYQQYRIGNCVFHYGCFGFWQPTWRVWAYAGGRDRWQASW